MASSFGPTAVYFEVSITKEIGLALVAYPSITLSIPDTGIMEFVRDMELSIKLQILDLGNGSKTF
jgi:hypothetical protein